MGPCGTINQSTAHGRPPQQGIDSMDPTAQMQAPKSFSWSARESGKQACAIWATRSLCTNPISCMYTFKSDGRYELQGVNLSGFLCLHFVFLLVTMTTGRHLRGIAYRPIAGTSLVLSQQMVRPFTYRASPSPCDDSRHNISVSLL